MNSTTTVAAKIPFLSRMESLSIAGSSKFLTLVAFYRTNPEVVLFLPASLRSQAQPLKPCQLSSGPTALALPLKVCGLPGKFSGAAKCAMLRPSLSPSRFIGSHSLTRTMSAAGSFWPNFHIAAIDGLADGAAHDDRGGVGDEFSPLDALHRLDFGGRACVLFPRAGSTPRLPCARKNKIH
jgi:hypothetical protein